MCGDLTATMSQLLCGLPVGLAGLRFAIDESCWRKRLLEVGIDVTTDEECVTAPRKCTCYFVSAHLSTQIASYRVMELVEQVLVVPDA